MFNIWIYKAIINWKESINFNALNIFKASLELYESSFKFNNKK